MKFLKKAKLWFLAAPLLSIALGFSSNWAVLISNKQTFPVRMSDVELAMVEQAGGTLQIPDGPEMLDPVHCVMTDKTHLNALADNFLLGGVGTMSVGDGLEWGGRLAWLLSPFAFFFYKEKE
jgi:hypothetical protein